MKHAKELEKKAQEMANAALKEKEELTIAKEQFEIYKKMNMIKDA